MYTLYITNNLYNYAIILKLHGQLFKFCSSAILYSLSKQALNMRAFKLARQILTILHKLRIPHKYQVKLYYLLCSLKYFVHVSYFNWI